MNSFIDVIIEAFNRAVHWFVETGLAEKTADTIARIITFDGTELDRLMWDFLNTLFGR